MKPVIGITAGYNSDNELYLRRRYCESVRKAGGVPIVLPPDSEPEGVLKVCQGVIFSGGGDIAPEQPGVYELDTSKVGEPSPERDEFELELARLAYERKVPTLAICRGIQVLNAAFGGTLLPDIPGHIQKGGRSEPSHRVSITAGTRLYDIAGGSLMVNSFHHQAAGRISPFLRVSAVSEDGITEGLEAPDFFYLGVQWHPEHLTDPVSRALFEALISNAVLNGKKR